MPLIDSVGNSEMYSDNGKVISFLFLEFKEVFSKNGE